MKINVLFICSRNQWRSKTAETIFKNHQLLNVRSAGTASSARIKINEKLALWADVIFVMEKKHKQFLQKHFPHILYEKELINLEIPDEYEYMHPELIDILEEAVSEYLKSIE